ncbi:MAG: ferrochelatase [Pseudomonadota bacterium]|jgi:ferrochelatase|nr:ferrochelatase [Alphaproteobacteria bacterium]
MPTVKPKIAIVLANLGGPDSLGAVRPFLFNLFYDRAILRLPNPLRFFLALLISCAREKKARGIYFLLGGKSPLLQNTLAQARALKRSLEKDFDVLVVPVMRYWRPRARDVMDVLSAFNPDRVVFLPLYPQFSTTTTESSIKEWMSVAPQWAARTSVIDCYFANVNFIAAHQELIRPVLREASLIGVPRILFSAHGLPKKIVDGGDPYQKQIEATVALVMKKFEGVDFSICYQSRVGLMEWIGPSLGGELKRAAQEGLLVVVVPISFVSEHSETLVELDIEFAEKAREWGVAFYGRVPAIGAHPLFVKCLNELVRSLLKEPANLESYCLERLYRGLRL